MRLYQPASQVSLPNYFWFKRYIHKWDKVFKNGPSKICGRQPLENLKWYGLLRPHHSKFFKGCLPKILLGPFLNILSQLYSSLCANAHHEVITFEVDGMVQSIKNEYLKNGKNISMK